MRYSDQAVPVMTAAAVGAGLQLPDRLKSLIELRRCLA